MNTDNFDYDDMDFLFSRMSVSQRVPAIMDIEEANGDVEMSDAFMSNAIVPYVAPVIVDTRPMSTVLPAIEDLRAEDEVVVVSQQPAPATAAPKGVVRAKAKSVDRVSAKAKSKQVAKAKNRSKAPAEVSSPLAKAFEARIANIKRALENAKCALQRLNRTAKRLRIEVSTLRLNAGSREEHEVEYAEQVLEKCTADIRRKEVLIEEHKTRLSEVHRLRGNTERILSR